MKLRYLWALLITGAIYYLCLRFLFPGYFAPTAPFHPDLFAGQGFEVRPGFWREAFTLPRPAGYLAIRAMAELGLAGSLVAIIAVTLLNVVLLVRLIERCCTPRVSLPNIALYTLILFAQPEFYFNHRHDTLAILSCCYLLVGLNAWQNYLATHRQRYIALWIVAALLLCFTKETYFLAGLLFAATNVLFAPPKDRHLAVALTGLFGLLMILAYLHNTHASHAFFKADNGPTSPYYMSLAPASVAHGFWFFLTKQWTWPALALILLALATSPNRLRAALFVVAGLTCLAIHAVLPNHLDLEYAWVGALFTFAPILFLPAKPITYAAAVPLAGLALWSNHPGYATQAWAIEQEQSNRRVLASFNTIHHFLPVSPGVEETVVVTGLASPFQPFLIPSYLESVFGPGIRWLSPVPADRPGLHLSELSSLSTPNTYLLAYDDQGNLVQTLKPAQLAAGPLQDTWLIPELAQYQGKDHDFYALLKSGSLYKDWGLTAKARDTLTRAQAADSKNGYAPYLLGQMAEADHDRDAARRYYEQAVAADQPTPNPLFTAALARVR